MIERVESPVDLKLKLIPILQHMHHDAATATKVDIFIIFFVLMSLFIIQVYPCQISKGMSGGKLQIFVSIFLQEENVCFVFSFLSKSFSLPVIFISFFPF